MIISFHMHFISVYALLDQFHCLSFFYNEKEGENVYKLIMTMFFPLWMLDMFFL